MIKNNINSQHNFKIIIIINIITNNNQKKSIKIKDFSVDYVEEEITIWFKNQFVLIKIA